MFWVLLFLGSLRVSMFIMCRRRLRVVGFMIVWIIIGILMICRLGCLGGFLLCFGRMLMIC